MTGRDILRQVAEEHDLDPAVLLGPSAKRAHVVPRWKAMARMRDELGWSLGRIGLFFKRNHTTVSHGLKALADRERPALAFADPAAREAYEAVVEERLGHHCALRIARRVEEACR